MVFHVITFYIFYTRVLPSECFAFPGTNLKLLLQAGLSRTFKLVTLVSSNCICVVCIQCLIYMIDTPFDKRNLAWRAAKLLLDEKGIKDGVTIKIRKYIPVAAGMAGGSTDAAAVLVGVNRMFDLGFTKKELMERGVKLGADVPYCIMRGTALSEGIGEILTELPAPPQCHLVIAKPQISVSTKAVYGKLRVNELAPEEHPDIDGMMAAIKNGDLDGVIERLGNVLETVTVPDHPEISEIKEIMVENGACGSLMSGSGPTVFGIYKDRELAEKACQALREADGGRLTRQVYLTEFYNRKKAR